MSTESLLTVLKFCFLALLYLFLARVVRVVAAELRAERVVAEPPVQPVEPARTKPARKERRHSPVLHVLEPATRAGEVFPLDGELTVGRGGGCQVVLTEDTFVPQVHARVFSRDGRTYVEDLGSRNGTFVNGKRIDTPTRLRRGDRIQFGQTVAEVGG
jgi:FHA domain